jgi:hypothetical protein
MTTPIAMVDLVSTDSPSQPSIAPKADSNSHTESVMTVLFDGIAPWQVLMLQEQPDGC